MQPHVPRLGAFPLQVVVPFLGRGRVETAGDVEADRVAGGLLNLLVKVDGVGL